ncbi:hypothetical protein M758_2G005200 [Ceratodon purpureus]|nr:hypothetical protein M758_2G005200 [Ceratodon purpureus]
MATCLTSKNNFTPALSLLFSLSLVSCLLSLSLSSCAPLPPSVSTGLVALGAVSA